MEKGNVDGARVYAENAILVLHPSQMEIFVRNPRERKKERRMRSNVCVLKS
jgi:hypothetical protein